MLKITDCVAYVVVLGIYAVTGVIRIVLDASKGSLNVKSHSGITSPIPIVPTIAIKVTLTRYNPVFKVPTFIDVILPNDVCEF